MTEISSRENSVGHSIFRTDSLREGERFAVWREGVSPLFDSLPDEASSPTGFQGRVESFDLKNAIFSRSCFSPLGFRREKNYHADEGTDHLLVQLYLTGGYRGYNGYREVQVAPGDISLLDLGRTLETRALASENLTIVVPRDLLFSFVKPQQISFGTVIKAGSPMGNILGNHLISVWRNLHSATVNELEMINRTLLGTVVGAFCVDTNCPESRSAMEDATLETMQCYIHQNLAIESLGPNHICARFGCSRTQLYRLFAPVGGVASYIRERRLARCLDELSRGVAGRTRVVDVALRWGFTSHSHFCRLFKQAFGISPREAVERGRQHAVLQQYETQNLGFSRPQFHEWLRRL